MAVLWCGGEDVDFPNGNWPQTVVTSGNYRASYSRSAIAPYGGQMIKSTVFPGGAVTSCWVGARIAFNLSGQTNKYIIGLSIADSGSSFHPGLCIATSSASATRYALCKFDGTTLTQIAAETNNSVMTGGGIQSIAIQLTDYGVSGNVKVYLNGSSSAIIDYTGDLSVSGVDGFDAVALGSGNSSNVLYIFSEIIVADEDLRTWGLYDHYPNNTGDTNTWTNTYTAIDETATDDTDVIYATAAAQEHQSKLTAYPVGYSFDVKCVKIGVRATKGIAAFGTLKIGVKSGGTVSVDAGRSLTTVWGNYERYMSTNPVTATGWAFSDLQGPLQVDLQSAA